MININNVDKDFKFLFDDCYRQPQMNHRAEKARHHQNYLFDWSVALAILITVLWGLLHFG